MLMLLSRPKVSTMEETLPKLDKVARIGIAADTCHLAVLPLLFVQHEPDAGATPTEKKHSTFRG